MSDDTWVTVQDHMIWIYSGTGDRIRMMPHEFENIVKRAKAGEFDNFYGNRR